MANKKTAFTIIELMISIALISIIVLFLYSTTDSLRKSNLFYDSKQQEQQRLSDLQTLLFTDITEIRSNDINTSSGFEKEFDILKLKTANTLFGIENPYVLYGVSKTADTLFRAESAYDINLSSEDSLHSLQVLEISKDTKKFKVYKNGKNLLFFIESSNQKPLYFGVKILSDYDYAQSDSNTSSSSSSSSHSGSGGDNKEGEDSLPPAMPTFNLNLNN